MTTNNLAEMTNNTMEEIIMRNALYMTNDEDWTQLTNTKHKGKTLPQVIFNDPDYFFWAYENKVFKGHLSIQADEVYQKARNIKVPQTGEYKSVVRYLIHKPTRKFATIELIPESSLDYRGPDLILNVIDLSVPRQISRYDKLGSKNIISGTKAILFKNPVCKMTKTRCEEFFDDDNNFVI